MQNIMIIVWVYAAFIFVGGIIGWVKAKSRQSLVSGIVFGIALAVAGSQLSRPGAVLVALGLSLVLLTVFGIRLAKTRKLMPAGVSALASLIVVIILTTVLAK
jgi:uncharacterized membrane protein (UPF0136 family)